jgi:tRNA dimethylallyltransferase
MATEQTKNVSLCANPLLLIAGPTASGKSALAVALAEATGRLIINADAMQVYRDLDVLTARPLKSDLDRAAHCLYGQVDGAQTYSVGRWLEDIALVLRNVGDTGVIIVGGTGLYFDALTRGLAVMPHVPDDVRGFWRDQSVVRGAADLHAELHKRDPVMAQRLRPGDCQRIVRALEVLDASGQSLSFWQTQMSAPLVPLEKATGIVLTPDRAWLRVRIAERFGAMLANGAVDEVAALMVRNLPSDASVLKSLGVQPIAAFLRGECTREQAIARGALETGQYAKRQDTWFRNRMAGWQRFETGEAVVGCLNR